MWLSCLSFVASREEVALHPLGMHNLQSEVQQFGAISLFLIVVGVPDKSEA